MGDQLVAKDSATCPGDCDDDDEVGGTNAFGRGKPKYSEKTCPDATFSTTNPTCQTRARTRATAVWKPATNRFSYGAAQQTT
jgi:hypothetical protein